MRFGDTKKILATLGVCALVASVLVLTAAPASAETVGFRAANAGEKPLDVAATSSCGTEEATVPAASARVLQLDVACNYTVTGSDAAGLCVVEGGNPLSPEGYRVIVDTWSTGILPGAWDFVVTDDCVAPLATLTIEKGIDGEAANAAGALTTFTYAVTPFDAEKAEPLADGGPCSDQSSHSAKGSTDGAGEAAVVEVVDGYIADNAKQACSYAVSEQVPVGWTLTEVDSDGSCDEQGGESLETATVILTPGDRMGAGPCEAEFTNALDAIPLSVTKSFAGRAYYTTVDRADFHLFTPGACGTHPIDPFGGLVGSVGTFRTVNASQQPQIVVALEDVRAAGPNGACTYRIQENRAPAGCTPLDADGSDADGAYWEQTWVSGETTAFEFNIVNDCARPEPTPTATPTATTQPGKPGKQPGSKKPEGSGVPKFTG